MRWVLVLFMIQIGSPSLTWALSSFDQATYNLSKTYCVPAAQSGFFGRNFSLFHLYVLNSSLEESVVHAFKVIGENRGQLADLRVTGALGDFLHSEGFMQAMRECFPNENDHFNFVATLIVSEKLGNLLNLYFVTKIGQAGLRGAWKLLQLLSKLPPALKVVIKSSIGLLLAYNIIQMPSTFDPKTVEQMSVQQLQSQIENVDLELKKTTLTDDQRQQLLNQKSFLSLKKALEALN